MQMIAIDAPAPANNDTTRDVLVRVALDLFGRKGFEATSTREIAFGAGANIAAIAYHFGGKEGLRKGCAEFITGALGETLGPLLAEGGSIGNLKPSAARAKLIQIIDTMIGFLVVSTQAEPIARFMMREMSEPSSAFDLIHDSSMAPIHEHICALWALSTGWDAHSEQTRLSTLAMFGQVVYFRVARQLVLRRMDWVDVGPEQAAELRQVVVRNLQAAIDAARKDAAGKDAARKSTPLRRSVQ